MTFRRELRVTNSEATPIKVHLEPWGDAFELGPGESLDFSFEASLDGDAEQEEVADGLIVWGWPSSTVRVVKDGQVLPGYDAPYDNPVPSPPPGTKVSDFLRDMLGQSRQPPDDGLNQS